MLRSLFALAGALLLAGCAPALQEAAPPDPSRHPASVRAREAEPPRTTASLVADAYVAPVADPLDVVPASAAAAIGGHGGHDAHAGHGGAAAPVPSSGHAGHMNGPAPAGKVVPSKAAYSCPMHPEVVSAKPGKCPKCGMKLVPKAQSGMEKMNHGDMK